MKYVLLLFPLGLALGPPAGASAPPHLSTSALQEGIALRRKWDFKIMERVYLSEPSGWINTMPWLISSPALGDFGGNGPDLEVLTGTEEGTGEWFPRGRNSGRYIAISSSGAKLWDYETNNNAGRASPGLVDIDGDGLLEGTGGSTSGWMVHCFDGKGARRWRYECERNQNILAAPASADLTAEPGLETVAVAADAVVYCVSATGKRVWSVSPTEQRGRHYAAAAPAIADLDMDGRKDVVVNLLSDRGFQTFCLNGADGSTKWSTQPWSKGLNTVMSSPAILPQGDPCWRRTSIRPGAAHTWVFVAAGTNLAALKGSTGDVVWSYSGASQIVSSPAVGDVDGDGAPEVVIGDGTEVVCLNAIKGEVVWRYTTGAFVYSSPALGSRERSTRFRRDWPMFRHDPQRTGFYGFAPGPLAVYVGSDDGHLHAIDGRTGRRIDRFNVKFPDLIIQSNNRGPLKFMSSPSLADLDGNGTLEAVFTLVDRVWCIEDLGSASLPGPRAAGPGQMETVRQNTSSPRNAFTLAQIIHTGGWNPSVPSAARMLEELTRRVKLDVRPDMRPLSLRDDDLSRFPFLYITGHEKAALTEEEIAKLKGHLERGGFLLGEACCNSESFDRSMRALAIRLFPGEKLAKIDAGHSLFSKVYPVKTVRINGADVAPDFEGVTYKNRLAFLVTRQDYACSWGNECCTSDCASVAEEDSYKMMTNIVVTALSE